MDRDGSLDIAIIGIGVRAPGSRSVDEFWDNLLQGRECITHLGRDELELDRELVGNPRFVPAAGVIGDIDLFDAELFGISARDAQLMDPQHRLFLECAWEAFEDAGYDVTKLPRKVSVYGGQGASEYLHVDPWQASLTSRLPECERVYVPFSNHITARVSHALGLTGESVEIRAACATGLVALHLGCRSLMSGDADLSLVGSAHVFIPERRGYLAADHVWRFAPDGHGRSFDARAHGLVHTSGVGVLLLKRVDDAIRDRDPIYAVVKGTAVNNDGRARPMYIAPGLELQAECVAEAQAMAGVSADTITYVEAHGIAVPVADAIEVEALRRAFAAQTRLKRFCALGSLKPNIGHTVASAGMMGLIKTALALKYCVIPPQINFDSPHPNLNLDDSPFVIHREATFWEPECGRRRAGVHSFGMGGTNAHAVLEEVPESWRRENGAPRLLALSARTPAALETLRRRVFTHLGSHPEQALADVAYTMAVGRKVHPHRWAAVGGRDTLREALRVGAPLVAGPGSQRLGDVASHWLGGREIDWRGVFDGETRARIRLPTYPFQRQRYWLDRLELDDVEEMACG